VAGFRASMVVTAGGRLWTTGKHDSGMLASAAAGDALAWQPATLPPRCVCVCELSVDGNSNASALKATTAPACTPCSRGAQ
jgi:hypothetical protein